MKLPIFKIRASAAAEILGGKIGLTDAQQETYEKHFNRKKDNLNGVAGVKPLTDKMEEELAILQKKKDNPELPTGAKNYCQKWVKEQLYNRRKHFSNLYLEKGIQCEDEAIEFAANFYSWDGAEKNDEWFSNSYAEGTPDILLAYNKHVIDIKNSYDAFSFPLFETEIPTQGYDDQLQVYLLLTGYEQATLCYCLMNAPLNIMKEEMRRLSWKEGSMGEISPELYQKVKSEMTYDNIIPELRLKTFTVTKDPSFETRLIERVEMCRTYIDQLFESKGFLKQAA